MTERSESPGRCFYRLAWNPRSRPPSLPPSLLLQRAFSQRAPVDQRLPPTPKKPTNPPLPPCHPPSRRRSRGPVDVGSGVCSQRGPPTYEMQALPYRNQPPREAVTRTSPSTVPILARRRPHRLRKARRRLLHIAGGGARKSRPTPGRPPRRSFPFLPSHVSGWCLSPRIVPVHQQSPIPHHFAAHYRVGFPFCGPKQWWVVSRGGGRKVGSASRVGARPNVGAAAAAGK